MDDLLAISGCEIARRIRSGKLSSRQAVEAHIVRIQCVNPVINALVADRFDEARREADQADRARETLGPDALPLFHGVPFTVKECFELEGMPNTAGIAKRRHAKSTRDATVVARVRKQGAIPLGVTNTSEACLWMESVNPVYGRTNNPYDSERIAGGSSGGEAAIVGAGGSPFGVGSDIGGSIRGPAFFNGVFGHKPSGGLVPGSGQVPPCGPAASRILTTGPIARRAEDLMPLLRIMAGPDGADVGCESLVIKDANEVDLKGMTVLHVVDSGRIAVSDDLRGAQERVVEALAARGARIEHAKFEALKLQFEIWSAALAASQDESFASLLGEGDPVRPVPELLKWLVGRSQHTIMPLLTALTDPIPALFPKQRERLIAKGRALRAELSARMGPRGIMLYPTYSTPAPKHNAAVFDALRLHFPFAHQGIMNVLEFPSTAVPLGLNAQGLPLGCQVIADHGNDHLTIKVAIELEKIFGGWASPSSPRSAATSVSSRA